MRCLLLMAAIPALVAAQDVREIVRRACELDSPNAEAARNYTYLRREVEMDLDNAGNPRSKQVNTWDVTMQEGSSYRRLVGRNDQPLSPEEQKFETDKLQRDIEQRRKETAQDRARRIATYERRRNQFREPVKELPDAFDFHLVGEETIDGAETYVIDATPKLGYKPKSLFAFFYPKVKARLWISKPDSQWVKVDMEVLDTAAIGGILLRVAKGSRIVVEQMRLNDGVWVIKHVAAVTSTRVLLVKGSHKSLDLTYSDYKKFQTDSRLIPGEPVLK